MMTSKFLLIIKTIQQYWKQITICLTLAIVFLSLYPLPRLIEIPGNGRIYHLAAYFLLAVPLGLKKPNRWILFICLFIIFGGVIEMMQSYFNRDSSWLDFFSNTVGFIFGFFVGDTLNKKFPNR